MHLDLVQRDGQSKEFFDESSPKLLLLGYRDYGKGHEEQ